MKAIMSANYYRKVYQRFGKHSDCISNSENSSTNSENGSAYKEYDATNCESNWKYKCNNINSEMPPPPNRIACLKEVNISANKKRDIKGDIKRSQEEVDRFILTKADLAHRSVEMYKHVLDDFIKFSSTINSNLVSKYIKWKFKLNSNLKDEQIILEGTSLKYFSILAQFFRFIGHKINYTFLRKHYSKTPLSPNLTLT